MLKDVKFYVNGKPEGMFASYHKNGLLENQLEWTNGYLVGKGRYWYDTGQLQKEMEWAAPRVEGLLVSYWTISGIQTVIDGHGEVILYRAKKKLSFFVKNYTKRDYL